MSKARMAPVLWRDARIDSGFWNGRLRVNREVTIPLQYEKNREGGVLDAYQWDWWDAERGTPPWRIIMGDLGKWIEAASYAQATDPDAKLQGQIDDAVKAMVKGQKEDGYLYPNPLPREWRWANLQELHEHYEVGHDIEAAVARLRGAGAGDLMEAVSRAADQLVEKFGWDAGQCRGYDGHPEVELALVKLYRASGERRYLELAKFFVDARGTEPNYFVQEAARLEGSDIYSPGWHRTRGGYWYYQAHAPVREQAEAAGHAVRALYLYSGMADVAVETGDAELMRTCRRMWRSVTRRRMYVTGGVGSDAHGESFTFDHDLPNETAYAETCANIALVFFAHRMLQIEGDSEYADVMERALYNGVLSGVGLDGRRFSYANLLTAYPVPTDGGGDGRNNVALTRQDWFSCACCPPNIARLLASLGGYAYSTGARSLYVHLYLGGEVTCDVAGRAVVVRQTTAYPWRERVSFEVCPAEAGRFALALRVPGWCRGARIKVNGKAVDAKRIARKGYARIDRVWRSGDRVELVLPMPIERIEADARVRMNCGKVALQRGPVVYCLEQADNGRELADLTIRRTARLTAEHRPRLLGGVTVIRGKAQRRRRSGAGDALYRPQRGKLETVDFTAVPYCAWANRKAGEMIVWIRSD
ncbi:MAG: hypothetical protein CMJ49_00260 [Planctomycetaceae bacterium]|nr:hypothetical protein [Planctomycetaceae bacterium]